MTSTRQRRKTPARLLTNIITISGHGSIILVSSTSPDLQILGQVCFDSLIWTSYSSKPLADAVPWWSKSAKTNFVCRQTPTVSPWLIGDRGLGEDWRQLKLHWFIVSVGQQEHEGRRGSCWSRATISFNKGPQAEIQLDWEKSIIEHDIRSQSCIVIFCVFDKPCKSNKLF